MGGLRALNRHKNNDRLTKHGSKRTFRDQRAEEAQKIQGSAALQERPLRLIELTEGQEASNQVKFVMSLPTTKESLQTLLDELKTKENTLIGLSRIRVFYNPLLAENASTKEDFLKFVVILMQAYLDGVEQGQTEAISQHLKELASVEEMGQTVTGYMANQLLKLTEVLESSAEMQTDRKVDAIIPKMITKLIRCQKIYIEILECPQGRLLDCLTAVSAKLHQVFGEKISVSESLVKQFKSVIENDLVMMERQQSQCRFNPALVDFCLSLEPSSKLYKKINSFLEQQIQHPQIACYQIQALNPKLQPEKRPRLEYLQLNKQRPQSIPTYAPQIEKDFLIAGHWKEKQKNDENVIKRKLKKADKDAQRELKKDAAVIMQEKARLENERRKSRKVFKSGGLPKDEI